MSALLSVRVPDELVAVVDQTATATNHSRSEVIRALIEGAGTPGGVWVSYTWSISSGPPDLGAVWVHPSEVEALRAAVDDERKVVFVPFGGAVR